jgi:hypothetical protein
MKKIPVNTSNEPLAAPANFAAVLAIAAEMVRRLSANISKVQLQPMHSALLATKESAQN